MATCDSATYLAAEACYPCMSERQRRIARLQLLCLWLTSGSGMCDVDELLDDGKCFGCLSEKQRSIVKLQLLCNIFDGGGPPPPPTCESADTDLPHDELLEGFQPDNFENTWAFVPGAGVVNATVGYDTGLLTDGKPVGACDSGIHFEVLAGDAGEEYYRWDRGSVIGVTDEADLYFYIFVQAMPANDGDRFSFLNVGEGTDPTAAVCAQVEIVNLENVCNLRVQSDVESAFVPVNVGQWYKVQVHFDPTAAASYLSVEDGAHQLFTRSAARGIRYLQIGVVGGKTAPDVATFVMDLITLNTP